MQRRDIGYSILVHPNTGAEKDDHSEWALWYAFH
jgi:aromatic ring-cleaving dioxygenase